MYAVSSTSDRQDVCTGAGSEELAVAAMKAGFDDYVLKHPHHFPRLVSAVRSALEESARRRVAREAETRYRTLFEGVPVGLFRATLSGQILDANPALIRLLGFPSRESLMAVNLRDIHANPKSRRMFLVGTCRIVAALGHRVADVRPPRAQIVESGADDCGAAMHDAHAITGNRAADRVNVGAGGGEHAADVRDIG